MSLCDGSVSLSAYYELSKGHRGSETVFSNILPFTLDTIPEKNTAPSILVKDNWTRGSHDLVWVKISAFDTVLISFGLSNELSNNAKIKIYSFRQTFVSGLWRIAK